MFVDLFITETQVNSSPPSAAYMRHWTGSSLVHVIACRLFGAKPLPEPMLTYCQLDSWEQILVKFESEFCHFHSRKCNWKCRLPKWRPFCSGGGGRGDELIITGCRVRSHHMGRFALHSNYVVLTREGIHCRSLKCFVRCCWDHIQWCLLIKKRIRAISIWKKSLHLQPIFMAYTWWRHQMGTFSTLLDLCEGNPLVSAGYPSQSRDAELFCYLLSAPEQTAGQTMETPVIWGVIALIMMSLLWKYILYSYLPLNWLDTAMQGLNSQSTPNIPDSWVAIPHGRAVGCLSCECSTGLIQALCPTHERRRYFITTPLIGWVWA